MKNPFTPGFTLVILMVLLFIIFYYVSVNRPQEKWQEEWECLEWIEMEKVIWNVEYSVDGINNYTRYFEEGNDYFNFKSSALRDLRQQHPNMTIIEKSELVIINGDCTKQQLVRRKE